MARPATGNVVTRKLAGGETRYALRFRANGQRQFETLGTAAEGWNCPRAEEALKDRLAEVRLGTYVSRARLARRVKDESRACRSASSPRSWFADGRARAARRRRWTRSAGGCPSCCLPFWQHHGLSARSRSAEVDRYRAAKVRERDLLAAARARWRED